MKYPVTLNYLKINECLNINFCHHCWSLSSCVCNVHPRNNSSPTVMASKVEGYCHEALQHDAPKVPCYSAHNNPWFEEKVICYQLWDRKISCQRFDWMLQLSSGRKSASYFPISKLVTDNFLFIYVEANWEATENPESLGQHNIITKPNETVQIALTQPPIACSVESD